MGQHRSQRAIILAIGTKPNMQIKTVRCHKFDDDITKVTLDTIDLEPPAAHEIQVSLKACAVNFIDILMIQGKHQRKPPRPFAPGNEAAGDVIAIGSEVTNVAVGDKVVLECEQGGFAEALNVSADAVKPMPRSMDYAAAASFQTTYLTAWVGLAGRAQLQPGENLLVHGATGGCGMAAVDLGKYLGAKVIATGGRDDKLEAVKSRGADHVINYTMPDGEIGGFRDAVKALTSGRGADVIFDPVGGGAFDESMRCINFDGRLVTLGFTSGRWPQAAVNLILIKQLSILGVRARHYRQKYPENTRAVYELADNGKIKPCVCRAFPLEEAVAAMQLLESRNVIGKCVVTMNGYTMESTS